jgi:hypothetical protein
MNEQDKTLMAQYGITCSPKMMYFYKQYRYEHLADALSYAESDTRNTHNHTRQTPADK